VIQGGMNLVWTTRVVRDWVFCDGAANEGVANADTRVTAASGLCTREPCFALGETDEARSDATEADPVGCEQSRQACGVKEYLGAWELGFLGATTEKTPGGACSFSLAMPLPRGHHQHPVSMDTPLPRPGSGHRAPPSCRGFIGGVCQRHCSLGVTHP